MRRGCVIQRTRRFQGRWTTMIWTELSRKYSQCVIRTLGRRQDRIRYSDRNRIPLLRVVFMLMPMHGRKLLEPSEDKFDRIVIQTSSNVQRGFVTCQGEGLSRVFWVLVDRKTRDCGQDLGIKRKIGVGQVVSLQFCSFWASFRLFLWLLWSTF